MNHMCAVMRARNRPDRARRARYSVERRVARSVGGRYDQNKKLGHEPRVSHWRHSHLGGYVTCH
jgi:hypothetical protein